MPVLPVLFKHIGKTESYRKSLYMLRYFRLGSTPSKQSQEGEKSTGSEESERPHHRIRLAIPRPTMTGLRTFIRGGAEDRSQLEPEAFGQLDSVVDDELEYHVQLKATRGSYI